MGDISRGIHAANGVHTIREARRHTTDGLLLWLKTAQPGKDEYIRANRILAGTAYHVVHLGALR